MARLFVMSLTTGVMMTTDIKKLFRQARKGTLPEGFDRWEPADKYGQTVAHVAARFGNLPEGVDRWDLADEDGWTVAHEAAYYGRLPEGFDRWDLADKNGKTVRDVANDRSNDDD
jgi:hypothetical protein